jgi:hypothetical protein
MREWVIRLVLDAKAEPGKRQGHVRTDREPVGHQPGNVAFRVTQAKIDAGNRSGTTTDHADRLAELDGENRDCGGRTRS